MSATARSQAAGKLPRSFAAVERFLGEIAGPDRRPGYLLLGNEAFLYGRLRAGVLEALVPADLRQFCLHDLDLAETSIFEALDMAQSPSLMAPFQVIFLRNLKVLFGRGAKKDEFAAVADYFRRPNSQALLIFVADHLTLAGGSTPDGLCGEGKGGEDSRGVWRCLRRSGVAAGDGRGRDGLAAGGGFPARDGLRRCGGAGVGGRCRDRHAERGKRARKAAVGGRRAWGGGDHGARRGDDGALREAAQPV